MSQYHTPIMVPEVLEGLQVASGKRFIDATMGGGGHTREIVKQGGIVLGIDTDREAIEEARKELKTQNSMTRIVQGNFRSIKEIAKENGFEQVDGILFDLGVSSHQLDTPERGFSYRFGDAQLDLRLNQHEGISAEDYIKHATAYELEETIGTFGEEEHARTIATTLVRERRLTPIHTTGDLYKIIEDAVGPGAAKATASRVFQAIRIEINDEFGALKEALTGAKALIAPGGRLVVISFHSLEDRIVKQFIKSDGWKLITKKPMIASEQEVAANKRARSAKLRIAQRL